MEILPDSRRAAAGFEKAEIRILSDPVIDQIAAGEVVERPASVVKELVENSLDADAQRVRIEVRDGGRALIAVSDDGIGMSRGDAQLCLQRHATSKLGAAADLERIHPFGFRGEALPSIASVSRLRLRTRLRGDSGRGVGWEIRLEGGRVVDEREVSAAEGTRIEVADLFESVPARRKFLKKASTEWGHIADWVGRLALALPGVHFELARDDRPAISWPATSDPLARIAAVLSERDAAALVAVEHEDPSGHVQAFVSIPEHTRANTNGLYLFVNGRPVRDRLLRQALLDVYRDWLPRGRFPTAVLFLTLPLDQVDVNVHPAKWEVRFADPGAIRRLVRHSVKEAIGGRSWLGATAAAPGASSARWATPSGPARSWAADGASGNPATSDWIFADRAASPASTETETQPQGEGEGAEPRLRFGDLQRLGQLRASYLLLEGEAGLILVDQHAAHERVLYERLRAQWLSAGVERQGLLLPITVGLDAKSVAAVREGTDAALRLGFELEPFGEDTVIVRAVPALLTDRDPAELVRELAHELGEERPEEPGADVTRWLPAADRTFATLACHAARRAGDHLVDEEQAAILTALDEIPWAPTCPHGRPVAVALDLAEIERRFGRR